MGPSAADDHITELFDRTYRSLVASALAITGDRGVAEEIVQEAFARLIVRWRRISSYDSPEAWLRLVTARLALRRRNQRWRESALPDDDRPAAVGPTGIDDDIVAALARLSVTDRKVLALHYFSDVSTRDISDLLGMAEATVRVHLHRGRERLRSLLPSPTSAKTSTPPDTGALR